MGLPPVNIPKRHIKELLQILQEILGQAGLISKAAIDLPDGRYDKTLSNLLIYLEQLFVWNKSVNLTGFRSLEDMAIKHVGDSALLFKQLPADQPLTILDIGTGAGVPGLILKILEPLRNGRLRITLVDAVRKKISFLRYIIGILGLEGIEALHVRLGGKSAIEQITPIFDIVTSQAVGELALLWRLGSPFMANGGIMIAMKGEKGEEEASSWVADLSEKERQGIEISLRHDCLPLAQADRTFVFIRTVSP